MRAARLLRPALVLATGVLAGCAADVAPQGILLITLDTTRADRLGCYGYEAAETPVLDGLAREAALFLEVQAPVPVTLPSHASMFTGQNPAVHGVRYNGMFRLPDSSVTIAEQLRDAGWATAAFPAAYPLNATTGIGQGFVTYDDMFQGERADELPPTAERSAAEIRELGLAWLDRPRMGQPFFLWLHIFDPHDPYRPPFPFSARFRDRPYDGEIAYADSELGRLFDGLRERGLWDDLLIVVAGDHGEGLYEHGERQHANLVYQSTLRVPLIVKSPRGKARVVDEPVSLYDLAPTMLDFAGLAPPPGVQGASLRPAIEGGTVERRYLYFESLVGSLLYGWSPMEGVRRGRYKYSEGGRPELYDLRDDPDETSNLAPAEPQLVADMAAELDEILRRAQTTAADDAAVETPLDSAALERLASLGYIGGTIGPAHRGGPHPPDLEHLQASMLAGRDLRAAGDPAAALSNWDAVLRQDPGNRFALVQACYTALELGDRESSHGYAEELHRRYPEFLQGTILLGESWVGLERPDRALEVFRQGLDYHPEEKALTYRVALSLLTLDRVEEATEVIEAAIAVGATEPSFVLTRAVCRARLGDAEGARADLRQALDLGYSNRRVLLEEPLLAPLRELESFERELARIVRRLPE